MIIFKTTNVYSFGLNSMVMNLLLFCIKPWPSAHFISINADLLGTDRGKEAVIYAQIYFI